VDFEPQSLTEYDPIQEEGTLQQSFILAAGRREYGRDPIGNDGEDRLSMEEHLDDYATLITLLCQLATSVY
jgi:hypothetical protein